MEEMAKDLNRHISKEKWPITHENVLSENNH